MRRWSLKLSWCTSPTFDYIHTSLSNFSPANATIWIIESRLVRWSCDGREMKRSRWWRVWDTRRARSISLLPLDSLLSSLLSRTQPWLVLTLDNSKALLRSQLMNSTWWQVWGLRPRQNTPAGTGISCCWRVKIFVIIESCDNLTNSKYWSSTIIIYRIVYKCHAM